MLGSKGLLQGRSPEETAGKLERFLLEVRGSPAWPGGKRHAQNVCAQTKAGCEKKLKALPRKMAGHRRTKT